MQHSECVLEYAELVACLQMSSPQIPQPLPAVSMQAAGVEIHDDVMTFLCN